MTARSRGLSLAGVSDPKPLLAAAADLLEYETARKSRLSEIEEKKKLVDALTSALKGDPDLAKMVQSMADHRVGDYADGDGYCWLQLFPAKDHARYAALYPPQIRWFDLFELITMHGEKNLARGGKFDLTQTGPQMWHISRYIHGISAREMAILARTKAREGDVSQVGMPYTTYPQRVEVIGSDYGVAWYHAREVTKMINELEQITFTVQAERTKGLEILNKMVPIETMFTRTDRFLPDGLYVCAALGDWPKKFMDMRSALETKPGDKDPKKNGPENRVTGQMTEHVFDINDANMLFRNAIRNAHNQLTGLMGVYGREGFERSYGLVWA